MCPDLWDYEDDGDGRNGQLTWSDSELLSTLFELGKISTFPANFCFFVVGLDQYNGTYRDLITFLDEVIQRFPFEYQHQYTLALLSVTSYPQQQKILFLNKPPPRFTRPSSSKHRLASINEDPAKI